MPDPRRWRPWNWLRRPRRVFFAARPIGSRPLPWPRPLPWVRWTGGAGVAPGSATRRWSARVATARRALSASVECVDDCGDGEGSEGGGGLGGQSPAHRRDPRCSPRCRSQRRAGGWRGPGHCGSRHGAGPVPCGLHRGARQPLRRRPSSRSPAGFASTCWQVPASWSCWRTRRLIPTGWPPTSLPRQSTIRTLCPFSCRCRSPGRGRRGCPGGTARDLPTADNAAAALGNGFAVVVPTSRRRALSIASRRSTLLCRWPTWRPPRRGFGTTGPCSWGRRLRRCWAIRRGLEPRPAHGRDGPQRRSPVGGHLLAGSDPAHAGRTGCGPRSRGRLRGACEDGRAGGPRRAAAARRQPWPCPVGGDPVLGMAWAPVLPLSASKGRIGHGQHRGARAGDCSWLGPRRCPGRPELLQPGRPGAAALAFREAGLVGAPFRADATT